MEGKSVLNLTPLKNQVYEYLRYQMRIGEIRPGSVIDMNGTSQKLGISRTPLRDALIQLEMEGFVKVMPRRAGFIKEKEKPEIIPLIRWEAGSFGAAR